MAEQHKKYGGIIVNWQLHHLNCTAEQLEERAPGRGLQPLVLTGTVKEDPTGRWQPGWHMRSSFVVHYDEEKGIVETENTVYQVEGPGDSDAFPDLGDGVFLITYE